MSEILSNPLVIGSVVLGLIVVLAKFFFQKNSINFKEFVPIKFEKTTYDEINDRMKVQGTSVNGKLRLGYNIIAKIDKFMEKKGEFSILIHDGKNKCYNISSDKSNYDLVILRAVSDNLLFRIMGLKKNYFLLHKRSIMSFDSDNKIWVLKSTDDIIKYGNVWMNSDEAMEWVNNISIKKSMESTMTQLQNYPDKLVHLEVEQAKQNQLLNAQEEAYKGRYEQGKKASDTVFGGDK